MSFLIWTSVAATLTALTLPLQVTSPTVKTAPTIEPASMDLVNNSVAVAIPVTLILLLITTEDLKVTSFSSYG